MQISLKFVPESSVVGAANGLTLNNRQAITRTNGYKVPQQM